ncbi:MucR family transcriptional regulator [Sphingomonas quercus]|uniref:MucR family transcriptional regulator n=1 Tax=Sphingomonas quercus TaxID=2842451 RepID=A0ABS6BDA9_9SPHN|nr:MucR family transcriptional regulator [Sphingomonas quercus]MBU3076310.1 MucR family transcriptional regulator [Sphingomonas quercus]
MADNETLITLTADIVASFVAHNHVGVAETPDLIRSVHDALSRLGQPDAAPEPEKPKGAVSIRASIKPDGIISMIDGRKYQTLRRHISGHGYTPETYRDTFGLPRDYPMVSANYSETRRAMAKKIGLGRKRAAEAAPAPVAEAPKKAGRKPRAAAAAAPVETPKAPARRRGPRKSS